VATASQLFRPRGHLHIYDRQGFASALETDDNRPATCIGSLVPNHFLTDSGRNSKYIQILLCNFFEKADTNLDKRVIFRILSYNALQIVCFLYIKVSQIAVI
jgi:hypothetical protein